MEKNSLITRCHALLLHCLLFLIVSPPVLAVAPGTPANLTATPGDGEITLNWTPPPDDGQGAIEAYNVYRCEGAGCAIDVDSDWLAWVTTGTTYTDVGTADKPFISGMTHHYAVAAYRGEEGNWSNEVEAVAQGEPPPQPEEPETSLAAPTGLTVTVTSEASVSLGWTAPADGILGYNVNRCSLQAGETTCDLEWHAWVANEGDAPPAPTSYTDTGGETGRVAEGATYLYAVAASYPPDYANGQWSETVTAITQETPPPITPEPGEPMDSTAAPGIPTNLTATSGDGQITLSWTPPSGTVTGWELLIRPGTDSRSWMSITPTGTTTKSYTVSGLTNGTRYVFAVRAVNGALKGAYARYGGATAMPGTESISAGNLVASFESGSQWFRRDVLPKLSGITIWNSGVWKGERIQQHILVKDIPSNSQISLVSSDLTTGTNDTIPANAVSFRYPGFVAGHSEVRSCSKDYQVDNTTVYLSDALFSEPVQALPPSWPELVWVSVDIPSETPAGDYSGTVTVNAVSEGISIARTSLDVSIQVAPWTMPDAADRQFHLDFWQFPVSVLDRYNDANPGDRIEIWSEEHYALLEPTYRYLAELGQRTVTTYIKEGALGAPSMIQWTLKSNGAWEYDYSVFDAYVVRLASWGLDQQISAFSPIGWNLGDIPYWDEATQSKKTFHSDVGSSAWNTRWSHFLTDFRAHLLEKEWLDKTVLYLDESSEAALQAVIDLVGAIDESWNIGLAYIGYGDDGPGDHVLSKLYDSSGSMALVGTTYVDTGLITGETYRYAVDACNDRCSDASSPVTVVVQTPAGPEEPTGLTATNTAGITLNWTSPTATGSSALTGYNVYRCEGDASCTPAWLDRVVSGTAYTDSNVTANKTYRYTVEACNGTGCGNLADEITVMTADTVNQQSAGSCSGSGCGNQSTGITVSETLQNQAIPRVPTDLTAFAASATAIQLSWMSNATNGHDVYRCTGSETCTPIAYLGWTYADSQATYPNQISTFYTSCVQPRPNSFVAANADPADVAALPWHALQRRQDGYLRWAFDNWRSYNPLDLREGAYTAGDFSLVYRSSNDKSMTVVPSIRSELLRDGIDDFEKVQVLRNSLSECSKDGLAGRWLDRLERTVNTFSSGALMAGRASDLINWAHDRLGEISLQLTPDMCQINQLPTPDP